MDKLAALWDVSFFPFSKEESVAAGNFRDWLSHSESKLGRFLAEVEYLSLYQEFSGSDVSQLEQMILKASGSKAKAHLPLRMLRKIVSTLNQRLHLSIPLPSLAIRLTPPESPFVAKDSQPINKVAHGSIAAWLGAEKRWLSDLRPSPTLKTSNRNNIPVELVLFSAALHGGILSSDLIVGLYCALSDSKKFVHFTEKRIYVDIPVAWRGEPDKEIRRWYPDDAVVCLIARLSDANLFQGHINSKEAYRILKVDFCNSLYASIRKGLKNRDVPDELLPASLSDFLARIALVLRSEIPAVMVGYATRTLDSRSLHSPSIDRIYGGPAFEASESGESDDGDSVDTENSEAYSEEGLSGLEPAWMQQIRACFYGSNKKTTQERFSALKLESPVGTRIIGFAERLLKHTSSSGNTLHLNSVKCCVLTVGRRLAPLLEERDPNKSETAPDVLEDLYIQAIDNAAKDSRAPVRLQGTISWALREFHSYLVAKRIGSPLNDASVFRVRRGFLSVDASIASVEDVFAALEYIHYEPNSSWKAKARKAAQRLILIGFFAGLRTMEALDAPQRDFPGGKLLPIYVLPTPERNLKTANAARKIPVSTFIRPFEHLRKIVDDWAGAPIKSGHESAEKPLFESISDDVVIPIINDALRSVTGNENLRYYSLRHSFASWTLTRLLLSQFPQIPNLFPHLPKTTEWLMQSKQFRRELYGNDLVENDHAWAVAVLMGHSTPTVSFASYCHTLDILLAEYLRASGAFEEDFQERLRLSGAESRSGSFAKVPSTRASAAKTNSDPIEVVTSATRPEDDDIDEEPEVRTSFVVPEQTAIPGKADSQNRDFARNKFRKRRREPAANPTDISSPKRDLSWLEQTWGLLYMHAKPGRDLPELARHLDLNLPLAQEIITRWEKLCSLKSPLTGHNLLSTAVIDSEISAASSTQNCQFPKLPKATSMKIAKQLADRIYGQIRKSEAKTIAVIDYYSQNIQPDLVSFLFVPGGFRGANAKVLVRDCRWFLDKIGDQGDELYYDCADGSAREYPRADWYPKWGLQSRGAKFKIANMSGKSAGKITPAPWLRITPRRARRGCSEFARTFLDGFRFVMLLAVIRFSTL